MRIRVEAVDHGPDLDQDDVGRLFEPFATLGTARPRRFGATGLGLTVARQVVETLGGELAHRPTPGGGNTYAFEIDLRLPDTGAPDSLDDYARTWLAGRRVLIAHSDVALGGRLAEQLEWWRMRAGTAETIDAVMTALRTSLAEEDPYEALLVVIDPVVLGARPGSDLGLAQAVAGDSSLDEVVMIVLAAQALDPAVIRELGVSVCLNRPVPGDVLRGTLLEQLAGVASQPVDGTVDVPDGQRRRVLVVEDNPVNQLVATGLLESIGYDVDVADDGAIALTMLERRPYDGVLMDVQMPTLDGYETTRALRRSEAAGPGARRTPVVAMTASAVEGERERCLASGMDDFLTKPVDPVALATTLDRWVGPLGSSPVGGPGPDSANGVPASAAYVDAAPVLWPPTPPIEGLDTARLDVLRDLDPGDTSYLDRAIGNFTVNSETVGPRLRALVSEGDLAGVRAAAHKIAGSALNLGAPEAGESARAVETLTDTGALEGIEPLLDLLETEMARARGLLARYQQHYRALQAVTPDGPPGR